MQSRSNQTIDGVPRELLERAISATMVARGPGSPTERDLRALLDAPVEPSKFVGAAQYWSENEQALRDVCRFEGLKGLVYQVVRDYAKPAAQPQGEPVARIDGMYGDPEAFAEREIRALCDVNKLKIGTLLYTEQPAPVEVECTEEMYKAFVNVMNDSNNGSETYKDVVKNAIEAAIAAS